MLAIIVVNGFVEGGFLNLEFPMEIVVEIEESIAVEKPDTLSKSYTFDASVKEVVTVKTHFREGCPLAEQLRR